MAADDVADDTAMIFTEADVFMIAGYLADHWGVEDDATEDVEHAITAVLADQLQP